MKIKKPRRSEFPDPASTQNGGDYQKGHSFELHLSSVSFPRTVIRMANQDCRQSKTGSPGHFLATGRLLNSVNDVIIMG